MATLEMLIGACAAHGLERTGSRDELHRRLGDFLVAKLFAELPAAPPRAAPSRKRPATAWQVFVRSEAPRVRAAGFVGRHAIVKEAARRWALAKQVGTSGAPLMLGLSDDAASSASSAASDAAADELVEALAELSRAELAEALEAHGLPVAEEHAANAAALARALEAA